MRAHVMYLCDVCIVCVHVLDLCIGNHNYRYMILCIARLVVAWELCYLVHGKIEY